MVGKRGVSEKVVFVIFAVLVLIAAAIIAIKQTGGFANALDWLTSFSRFGGGGGW